jgi:hypothetical protein
VSGLKTSPSIAPNLALFLLERSQGTNGVLSGVSLSELFVVKSFHARAEWNVGSSSRCCDGSVSDDPAISGTKEISGDGRGRRGRLLSYRSKMGKSVSEGAGKDNSVYATTSASSTSVDQVVFCSAYRLKTVTAVPTKPLGPSKDFNPSISLSVSCHRVFRTKASSPECRSSYSDNRNTEPVRGRR